MTWVRIDDCMPTHRKVLTCPVPLADTLQMRASCYCSHNLTDGFLPHGALPVIMHDFSRITLDGKPATEYDWPAIMVEAKLWERTKGGFLVHDYLDYNPSRAQVLASREQRKEAAIQGGKRRAEKADRQQNGTFSPAGNPADSAGGSAGESAGTSSSRESSYGTVRNGPSSEEKEPPKPPAPGAAAGASGAPPAGPPGKALKDHLHTPELKKRGDLICGGIEKLPRKAVPFNPWQCLTRMCNQRLPVEIGLQILLGVRDRWATIEHPWKYVQSVLDKEHTALHIRLQLEEHEKLKREPAVIGDILAAAQQRAQQHPGR